MTGAERDRTLVVCARALRRTCAQLELDVDPVDVAVQTLSMALRKMGYDRETAWHLAYEATCFALVGAES